MGGGREIGTYHVHRDRDSRATAQAGPHGMLIVCLADIGTSDDDFIGALQRISASDKAPSLP